MKLYHLAYHNLGHEINLLPSTSEDKANHEIDTPRVCAAPSIEQCIVSLHKCEKFKQLKEDGLLDLFVYEIENPDQFLPYKEVYDFKLTDEHISFQKAKAKLVCKIHIPRLKTMKYIVNPISVELANCVYMLESIK